MLVENRLQRRSKDRPYKKLFILVTEGKKTEPEYFAIIRQEIKNSRKHLIDIKTIQPKNSAPQYLLKSMQRVLEKENFNSKIDEAWIVADKDEWPEEHIEGLNRWAQEQEYYGLAVSNPNFEYWLLLHFEDGTQISSAADCSTRLKKWLPDYNKGLNNSKIILDHIKNAIKRAKNRDRDSNDDWPKAAASTTVYRLVEKLLDSNCGEVK
jgi:hypothetical protein